MRRQTFLSHWIICLLCAGGFSFAWHYGVPQLIWANGDAGYFGAAVGLLVLSAMGWLGWQAWNAERWDVFFRGRRPPVTADFGHLASVLSPAIGMLGTIVGLSKVFAAGGDTIAMIQKAQTAFFSTGCGIVGMIVIMVMTHSLEAGIKRAGR